LLLQKPGVVRRPGTTAHDPTTAEARGSSPPADAKPFVNCRLFVQLNAKIFTKTKRAATNACQSNHGQLNLPQKLMPLRSSVTR